jgi:hypothetical protein
VVDHDEEEMLDRPEVGIDLILDHQVLILLVAKKTEEGLAIILNLEHKENIVAKRGPQELVIVVTRETVEEEVEMIDLGGSISTSSIYYNLILKVPESSIILFCSFFCFLGKPFWPFLNSPILYICTLLFGSSIRSKFIGLRASPSVADCMSIVNNAS